MPNGWKIWLDDIRDPPEGWVVCRSFEEVQRVFLLLSYRGHRPEVMSFDHDLGDGLDGYHAIKWISEEYPSLYPDVVEVHSANPVGAENIRQWDEWFRRARSYND